MLAYTHVAVATGTTSAIAIAAGGGPGSIPVIVAAGIGSLIPDIDEPESTIGKKIPLISKAVKALAGHRGVTHSVIGVLGFAALALSVGLPIWGVRALPLCFALIWGYSSHIYLGDIFTRSGVHLLSIKKTVGIPKSESRRMKVGSARETTIFFFLALTGALELVFIFGYLKLPHFGFPNIHLPEVSIPAWLALPWWAVMAIAGTAAVACLFVWYRLRWTFRYAGLSVTYRVSFAFHSEDLPLRSEQLGNLLHELLLPRRVRYFTGQPHIRVVYANEGEKSLFITVPDVRDFPEHLKNAILDKLRGCRLERVEFALPLKEHDISYGRVVFMRKCPGYSLRTLKGFEQDDPLEHIFNAMEVGDKGRSYIFLHLKPDPGSWKRGARAIRERIRTEDDADMDRALKRSGLSGILSAFVSTFLAIFVSIIDCFQPHPAGGDSRMVATAMNPNAGHKDRRREMSEETKDIVKSMDDKINCRSSFSFDLTILVEKPKSSYHDVKRLAGSFRMYDKHQGLESKKIRWPVTRFADYALRRNLWPTFGGSGILSSDELAGLLHNPYKNTVLVRMDMNTSRTEPAPPPFTAVEVGRVFFGTNDHRGGSEPVSIPWHDFRHHAMIVGATGSGKSTLLKHIFRQFVDSGDKERPRGGLFLEPHGDACQELLQSLPARHIDRVYYLDPGEIEYPLAFNPPAYSDVITPDRTRDVIVAGFKAIWDITPEMANLQLYMARVMDAMCRVPGSHFGWIRPFITNDSFREEVLKKLDDPEATRFWNHFKEKPLRLREDEVRSLLNRVDAFVLDSRCRLIFCQAHSRIDFKKIIDEGKIVITHFGDRNAGPVNKRLLGSLFCSYIHQAAQARGAERRPFLIAIDECGEYISPNLAEILAQDRKFGIVLVAAFQYLSQVGELIEALKGNTSTRIAFNLGEEDALGLAPLFANSSDPDEVRRRADDLMNLSRYQGFIKSTVDGRPLPPTTFNLSKPIEILHWENAEKAGANTRRDLCRPRLQVEREFAAFTRSISPADGGESSNGIGGAADLEDEELTAKAASHGFRPPGVRRDG